MRSLKFTTLLLIVAALVLTGCNLPSGNKPAPSATPDIVATQVKELLTRMPTATSTPLETQTPAPGATLAFSATPLPTHTPLPTFTALPGLTASATPDPNATVNPGDPAATLGKPDWKDTLNKAKSVLYDDDNTRIEYKGDAMVLTSKAATGWVGWRLAYTQQSAENFYIEGVFKPADCKGRDLYGLTFRINKANAGYFFGVSCDGKYNLYARDFTNNVMAEIKPFEANAAILQGGGQVNRLGVLANGSKISLYANGVLLGDVNDGTYASGFFGPFIAGNETPNFSYQLAEISLWNIK